MAWWHTEWWHNLAFRPDKPALGYGARRAPRCGSRHALSASQVLEWAHLASSIVVNGSHTTPSEGRPRLRDFGVPYRHLYFPNLTITVLMLVSRLKNRSAHDMSARIGNGSQTRFGSRPSCPTTI
jgi:hypothetical protein